MNINNSCNSTSFGRVKANEEGVIKLWNTNRELGRKVDKTIEEANKKSENDLEITEDGKVYITTPLDGKFTIRPNNNAHVEGNTFYCEITREDGSKDDYSLRLMDAKSAAILNNKFLAGKHVASEAIDLYKAIEAVDNYRDTFIDIYEN